MDISYLEKQAAKEIIAVTLYRIKNDDYAAAFGWDELLQSVSQPAQQLADEFRQLDVSAYGIKRDPVSPTRPAKDELMIVSDQQYHTRDGTHPIPNRLVPRPTHEMFQLMNHEMKRDIDRSVVIQSGYRSPAYQLFVFLFQLKRNSWNFAKTIKTVALPGHSEHASQQPALDLRAKTFIGHQDNYDFGRTAEFRWLQEKADQFGFTLSYPKGNQTGTRFEPWHWRHTEALF